MTIPIAKLTYVVSMGTILVITVLTFVSATL